MDKSHLFLKLLNFFIFNSAKKSHSNERPKNRWKEEEFFCGNDSRTDQHPHNHYYEYVRHSILSIINIAHLFLFSSTFHSLLKKFLNSFVRKLKNLNVVDNDGYEETTSNKVDGILCVRVSSLSLSRELNYANVDGCWLLFCTHSNCCMLI